MSVKKNVDDNGILLLVTCRSKANFLIILFIFIHTCIYNVRCNYVARKYEKKKKKKLKMKTNSNFRKGDRLNEIFNVSKTTIGNSKFSNFSTRYSSPRVLIDKERQTYAHISHGSRLFRVSVIFLVSKVHFLLFSRGTVGARKNRRRGQAEIPAQVKSPETDSI